MDEKDNVYQTRTRLTLIGEGERQEFPNAVMLSRSRFLADADRSLRFYREYFAPESEIEVVQGSVALAHHLQGNRLCHQFR
jgi:5-methylthioadenosine/S-adenosylhomocysteine deaminase